MLRDPKVTNSPNAHVILLSTMARTAAIRSDKYAQILMQTNTIVGKQQIACNAKSQNKKNQNGQCQQDQSNCKLSFKGDSCCTISRHCKATSAKLSKRPPSYTTQHFVKSSIVCSRPGQTPRRSTLESTGRNWSCSCGVLTRSAWKSSARLISWGMSLVMTLDTLDRYLMCVQSD